MGRERELGTTAGNSTDDSSKKKEKVLIGCSRSMSNSVLIA